MHTEITTSITTRLNLDTLTVSHDIDVEAADPVPPDLVYSVVFGLGRTLQRKLREEHPALFADVDDAEQGELDPEARRILSVVSDWSDEEFSLVLGFERGVAVEEVDAGNGGRVASSAPCCGHHLASHEWHEDGVGRQGCGHIGCGCRLAFSQALAARDRLDRESRPLRRRSRLDRPGARP